MILSISVTHALLLSAEEEPLHAVVYPDAILDGSQLELSNHHSLCYI